MNRTCLAMVAACCGFLWSLLQQDNPTPEPIAEISPSVALWALETAGDAQHMKRGLDLASDSILVYRVAVSADGRILRSEKISGDSKLQTIADPVVYAWNFRPVEIKGSTSPWQSFIDVCFFRDGGYMLPCSYFSQAQSKEGQSGGAPVRLSLVGYVKDRPDKFPPLHKKRGARLERPTIVRQIGGTGEVIVDVAIAEDGHVSGTTGVMGPPLLSGATVKTIRDWRFEPFSFLGKPVEVQLRLTVLYGPKD